MKKNLGFIIVAFVIILVLFFVFRAKNRMNDFSLSAPVTYCFSRDVNDYDGKDMAYIRADLATDNTVTGVLNISYLDEYKVGGNFIGIWEGDGKEFTLDVLHTYNLQGVQRNEERAIKFDEEAAFIGHGPLAEKDGIMFYSDRDNVNFYDMLLPRPCEDIPAYIKEGFN